MGADLLAAAALWLSHQASEQRWVLFTMSDHEVLDVGINQYSWYSERTDAWCPTQTAGWGSVGENDALTLACVCGGDGGMHCDNVELLLSNGEAGNSLFDNAYAPLAPQLQIFVKQYTTNNEKLAASGGRDHYKSDSGPYLYYRPELNKWVVSSVDEYDRFVDPDGFAAIHGETAPFVATVSSRPTASYCPMGRDIGPYQTPVVGASAPPSISVQCAPAAFHLPPYHEACGDCKNFTLKCHNRWRMTCDDYYLMPDDPMLQQQQGRPVLVNVRCNAPSHPY